MNESPQTKIVLRKIPVAEDAFRAEIDAFLAATAFFAWRSCKAGGHMCWIAFRPERAKDLLKLSQLISETLPGVVCSWAPFQGIPGKGKEDHRKGTILEDPEYIKFLEEQSKLFEVNETEVTEMMNESALTAQQPKTTPLLDSIRQKKLKRQEKSREKRMGRAENASVGQQSSTDARKVFALPNVADTKKKRRKPKNAATNPFALPKQPILNVAQRAHNPNQSNAQPENDRPANNETKSGDSIKKKPKFILVKRDGTQHAIGESNA